MAEKLVKLDLNKLRAKDGVIHVKNETIETEKLFYEKPLSISGTITAPANYIEKRLDQDDKLRSNVQFSYRTRKIDLHTHENYSEFGSHITGQLKVNPDIAALQINTTKVFSVAELTKHVRFNKLFFASAEQHSKIVEGLQRFTAKVNQEIKQIDDRKGNIEDSYKVTLNSSQELSFKVKMPVFEGEQDKVFLVEVQCEARNRAVEFWLESTELMELLESDTKSIIDAQLERFPKDFVFIQQ